MTHYFLKEDFNLLNKQIEEICDTIKQIGKDMGDSCKEGAETFHDNFVYEEGERNQVMWSKKLRDLIALRNSSRIFTPDNNKDRVSIGRIVTVQDESTGEEFTYKIGSFSHNKDPIAISYNAPIIKPLIGAEIGENRETGKGEKTRTVKIIKIE